MITDDWNREFSKQLVITFERRHGIKFSRARFLLLSRQQQDDVVTEAGKEVQRLIKERNKP